ncbi:MAG: hypothetical protein HRT47_10080 [Candidatus Caenarcaniphilales bacterium]|nr:hypothetical protein [Candidatus Caenarcaniphilales bacterium]
MNIVKRKELRCLSLVAFPDEIFSRWLKDLVIEIMCLDESHYFYREDHFHITIKKISELGVKIEESLIEENINLLESKLKSLCFHLEVDKLVYNQSDIFLLFKPNNKLKNLRLELNSQPSSSYIATAHLTVCRLLDSPNKRLAKFIQTFKLVNVPVFKLREVELIACDGVCSPDTRLIYFCGKMTPENLLNS